MARIEIDPNYSSPTFPRATASTDLFKKEDVQQMAAALSTHDHTTGKGAVLVAGSIPAGSITSGMIADGTIVAGDIADGAVTSAKILDGTIAAVDLADAAVTNAKLASDTARANLLTNGGFEIWQRGNGPLTTGYTADRWAIGMAGSDTISVSRDTANPDASYGGKTSAACTFTLGSGAGVSNLGQKLDWDDLPVSRAVTASMRVRTSTANAVRIGLYNGAAWTYSAFHSGSGAYETLSVTATFQYGVDAYCDAFFAASCTAYIDNAMLVVGSVAADYAPLHPADDLARCQRYYEVIGQGGLPYPMISGYVGVGSDPVYMPMSFNKAKAVAPTATRIGTWTYVNGASLGTIATTTHGLTAQVIGSAAGRVAAYPASAGDYFTVEGNP